MNLKANIKKLYKDRKQIKALADVVIDNAVVIHGIKVCEGENGKYVLMPSFRWTNKDGESVTTNVCYPINEEVRTEINDAVLGAYEIELIEMSKMKE